jgi:hypothetical protein
MLAKKLSELFGRRAEICNEISEIETMRRGTLNEFYYNSTLKDGTVKKRGPFYNVTYSGKNKRTVSKSVSKKDIERVKEETDNYRKFRELSDEYVEVCETIAILTRSEDEAKKN